jgi:hypothetical protein
MVGHIAYIEDIRTAEGNSPFGRPGYGWEDNIKCDLKETGGRMGPSHGVF